MEVTIIIDEGMKRNPKFTINLEARDKFFVNMLNNKMKMKKKKIQCM